MSETPVERCRQGEHDFRPYPRIPDDLSSNRRIYCRRCGDVRPLTPETRP